MQRDDDRPDSGAGVALARSFRSAAAGWRQAVRHERSLRIHLVAAGIAGVLSWCLRLSGTEIALIVAAVAAVWTAELVNTSIERVVDLASPEHSHLARDAKDIAAAAVLTAAVAAVLIGLLVFGPPVAALLAGAGAGAGGRP